MREPAKPLKQMYIFGGEKYICPCCDYPLGNTDEIGISRIKTCPQCKQDFDWGDVL